MKKLMSLWMTVVITFALFPVFNANAELADGKYSLPYQVNKAGSTSASIANDYFIKPATLIKKDGAMYVQMTLNKSSQFVQFEAPTGGNKVVATDAANDRRTVQFNVTDLGKALTVNVRLEIPEEDYYHNYKIDFVWFADKSKLIEAYAAPVKEQAKPAETPAVKQEAKPVEQKPVVKQEVKQETKPAEQPAATEAKTEELKVAATESKQEETKTEVAKIEEVNTEETKTEEAVAEPKAEDKKAEETIVVASAQTNDQATANEAIETASESGSSNTIMWIIIAVAIVFGATGGYGYYKKLSKKK